MVLKDTVSRMKDLLECVTKDLSKAVGGNKAASQRVRTGTIKLEKTAKMYRKESVAAEKKMKKEKPSKKAAKAPAKKAAKKVAKKKKR